MCMHVYECLQVTLVMACPASFFFVFRLFITIIQSFICKAMKQAYKACFTFCHRIDSSEKTEI